MSTLRQLARLRLVNSVRWRHCAVCFSLTSFWGHSGQAQANSAAGIVLSPATFSILNPSVFGENSAVAIGGAYGNRPEKKTYLFSASLSHVRFQFGRTYPSHPIGQTKELTTGLDYAAAIAHVDVSPALKFMSGFQASAGYGVINDMYGAGFEGMSAGILVPVAARISGPGVRLAPFFAPGFFLTREVIVGLGCASNTCHFSSNGLRVSLGGGVRLDLMGRLSIEAGVRKTQTANAISRQISARRTGSETWTATVCATLDPLHSKWITISLLARVSCWTRITLKDFTSHSIVEKVYASSRKPCVSSINAMQRWIASLASAQSQVRRSTPRNTIPRSPRMIGHMAAGYTAEFGLQPTMSGN